MTNRLFIILLLFIAFQFTVRAQKLNPQEVKTYTEECYDLIDYFQFTLNSVGDNDLSPKEKDIIISESYTKLFRDGKVQIEDDLVPNREAVTNKDVQAYLKDVDFFFHKVIFSYKVLSVNLLQNESGQAYFKIHALRTLAGRTLQNDSIYNEQARYIEVAIDPNLRDLKIVSVYTTKIDETIENIRWWNELPISWKEILGKQETICDNVEFSRVLNIQDKFVLIEAIEDSILFQDIDSIGIIFNTQSMDTLYFTTDSIGIHYREQVENAVNRILAIKELDLSKRLDIMYLYPLAKLSALHSLDVSKTLINDLYPIRNLIDLQNLNISNTQITNLDALIYSMALQNLDISYTQIHSLDAIANLSSLKMINFSNTHIDNIQALASLKTLANIKMENTMVSDLEPIKDLESINYIDIDNNPISDIQTLSHLKELKILSCNNTIINSLLPLSQLENLSIVHCENTEITSLKPLDGMPNLNKIYCDNTLLGKEKALDYMNQNPHVLVVYETKKLIKWYEEIPETWKDIFTSYVEIDEVNPTKEQLHQIAGIAEIDISGHDEIEFLQPLSRIQNLQKLNASGTNITSLDALYELRELNWLDISKTEVSSISSLENSQSLNYLNISETKIDKLDALRQSNSLKKLLMESSSISNISPLMTLSGIKELRIDNSLVENAQIEEFIDKYPKCIVIYQSTDLEAWWEQLPSVWQQFFMSLEGWNNTPDSPMLHQLVRRTDLSIINNRNISDISSLSFFVFLETLEINDTQTSDLDVLKNFTRLNSIDLSQNPIFDLEVLGGLKNLRSIKISNTQIDYLDWVTPITHLQFLDISGTQIKNLKPLSSLYLLESLTAYNTRISSLNPLNDLISLRNLKVYNTKVSAKKVDQFKNNNPSCVVDFF